MMQHFIKINEILNTWSFYYTHANKEHIFQVPIFVEEWLSKIFVFWKMWRASSWLLWIYMLKWLTATQYVDRCVFLIVSTTQLFSLHLFSIQLIWRCSNIMHVHCIFYNSIYSTIYIQMYYLYVLFGFLVCSMKWGIFILVIGVEIYNLDEDLVDEWLNSVWFLYWQFLFVSATMPHMYR